MITKDEKLLNALTAIQTDVARIKQDVGIVKQEQKQLMQEQKRLVHEQQLLGKEQKRMGQEQQLLGKEQKRLVQEQTNTNTVVAQIKTILKVLEAGQNDIRENMVTKVDLQDIKSDMAKDRRRIENLEEATKTPNPHKN